MKRKVLILAIITFVLPLILNGQKILTLKECYDLAMASNPLAGEKTGYSEITRIRDNNLAKGWLPTLDANGSILYNSSVVDIGSALDALPIPGIGSAIKPLPNEQYKITVDINQVIFDGGAIKGARALEKASLNVNEKQTESDLYKLRDQINSCYFNIMLIDRQKELLNGYLDLIQKKINSMQSAVNNGAVLKSDLDVLASEKLKTGQQLSENTIRRTSLIKVLSDLTGTDIASTTQFILPAGKSEMTEELTRPELQLFDLRKDQLAAGEKLIESKRLPKAFGFATLGYGNPPGNNFFKNEFAPYYIVGAGVKWNIFDWNVSKNEKQLITLQQGIIDNRKKDMTGNLKRLLETKNAEIINLKSLIETDRELIGLRKKISATAESQYQNGTITTTEYLNELNSEQQALINFEIHKINLALAGVEYMNISGKEIE